MKRRPDADDPIWEDYGWDPSVGLIPIPDAPPDDDEEEA